MERDNFMIVFFSIATFAVLIGCFYLYLYYIFENKKNMIGVAQGARRSVKRKKNVELWEPSHIGGHTWHFAGLIKDWRRATYYYTVNQKSYRKRLTVYEDPEGLPPVATVVYWKRFPKIAYVKSGIHTHDFLLKAMVTFLFAILGIVSGVRCL